MPQCLTIVSFLMSSSCLFYFKNLESRCWNLIYCKTLHPSLAFQLWLRCAAAACYHSAKEEQSPALFSPKLSYKLSFHKAERAPVTKEFRPNFLYFYQTNITMGLSNPYRSCGETLVVFSFCAQRIGAQVGFFICFAILEGIEKSRREAELFYICQFINYLFFFYCLDLFTQFYCQSQSRK